MEGFYTVEELAEVLKVNEETIRRMIRTKKIKSYIKLGRGYRIPKEEIGALIEVEPVENDLKRSDKNSMQLFELNESQIKMLKVLKEVLNESDFEVEKQGFIIRNLKDKGILSESIHDCSRCLAMDKFKKSGKDINVPTKKTNREMLSNMDNFQLAHFIVENIMMECAEPICCCTFGSEECERLNTCVVGIMKWLESEVEE